MTIEGLQKAIELKAEIDKWENRIDMVTREHDRIHIGFQKGSVCGSYDVPEEEAPIILEALGNYYQAKLEEARKEFENFKDK